ncbi:MAG TPA: ester cyclase [Terriglobia bacterium]|nr:ester cyclase [Terriglobia bacterium]
MIYKSLINRGTAAEGDELSEEANKELVRRHYEDIVNLNNLDAAEDQMAEDFIDHAARPGIASRGPEAARQAMAALHAVIPDARITLDEVIAEGDLVAVRATWRGTHKGPFMGSPPSGKPVTINGMVFWRVADGKLVERWASIDLSPLRQN